MRHMAIRSLLYYLLPLRLCGRFPTRSAPPPDESENEEHNKTGNREEKTEEHWPETRANNAVGITSGRRIRCADAHRRGNEAPHTEQQEAEKGHAEPDEARNRKPAWLSHQFHKGDDRRNQYCQKDEKRKAGLKSAHLQKPRQRQPVGNRPDSTISSSIHNHTIWKKEPDDLQHTSHLCQQTDGTP